MDWDQHIAPSIFAYNVCVNTTTGLTPFFLTYGREARVTVDAMLPAPQIRHPSYLENIQKLAKTLQTAKRQTETRYQL